MNKTSALLGDTTAKSVRHGVGKNGQSAGGKGFDALFPDVLASLAGAPKDARVDTKLAARHEAKVAADGLFDGNGKQPSAEEILLSALAGDSEPERPDDPEEPSDDAGRLRDFEQLANLLLPQQGSVPAAANEIAPKQPATADIAGALAKAALPEGEPGTSAADPAMPADAADVEAVLPERNTTVNVVRQEAHFTPADGTRSTGAAAAPVALKSDKPQSASSSARIAAGEAASDLSEPVQAPEPAVEAAVIETSSADDEQSAPSDDRRPAVSAIQTATTADGSDVPAAPMSAPSKQIAAAVAAELAIPAPRTAAPVVTQVTETAAGNGSVLKVLHIKLEPETLGTVTVRMSLRDNAIEMHIEAADSNTAELISADRDALSNLLRSSGYAIDAPVVSALRADAASSAGSGQQPATGGQQAEQFAQGNRGSAESGRQQPESREQRGGHPAPHNPRGLDDDAVTGARAGGALYI